LHVRDTSNMLRALLPRNKRPEYFHRRKIRTVPV
jgi:hypothetical protein